MTTDKNLPTSPRSVKARFAVRFLRAMKKLNCRSRTPASTSMSEKYRRYRLIRAAAYSSMASAVGPRRAWSRAALRKARRNRGVRLFIAKKRRARRFGGRIKRLTTRGNPRGDRLGFSTLQEEDDLRELVPGGEGMGLSRLLNETAHYALCLRAQVQVMAKILDHYSCN